MSRKCKQCSSVLEMDLLRSRLLSIIFHKTHGKSIGFNCMSNTDFMWFKSCSHSMRFLFLLVLNGKWLNKYNKRHIMDLKTIADWTSLQNMSDRYLVKLHSNPMSHTRSINSPYVGIIFTHTVERGYNPETPYNFSYQSSMISTGWHAHLSYDWWGLPPGEAALALSYWQAPGNSSLDWTIVGVTLGPDSEVSVWVLGAQCWG